MLNRKKDFASVHGDESGAVFWQDQLLFHEDGTVITDHPTYSKDQTAKAKQHADNDLVETSDEEADEPEGVNLKDWATGDVEANWLDVRKAMKAKFGVSPKNQAAALALLVEEGVVTADDVKG